MSHTEPIPWQAARDASYRAGRGAAPLARPVPLSAADGLTLGADLVALTELPAFPTASVDGYATRGAGPWRLTGRVLAGGVPQPISVGTAMEIATGAMVPAGAEAIVRLEDATLLNGDLVTGECRPHPEWREPGEEANAGEVLLVSGATITPAVLGLAASCGYEELPAIAAPTASVVIFGDELLTAGVPGAGRVRDSLGPQLPAWLARLGARVGYVSPQPIADTLPAHVDAVAAALGACDVLCTTGGTMRGPVDHLHAALRQLSADYVVNTVAVRPGYPMLLAQVTIDGRSRFIAGLPGNPQSAIVALVSLVAPLLAGLAGRAMPAARRVVLGEPIPDRGDYTHLALVRLDEDGTAWPVAHTGSAMLRGLALADGFAVIEPGSPGQPGHAVPMIKLPLAD